MPNLWERRFLRRSPMRIVLLTFTLKIKKIKCCSAQISAVLKTSSPITYNRFYSLSNFVIVGLHLLGSNHNSRLYTFGSTRIVYNRPYFSFSVSNGALCSYKFLTVYRNRWITKISSSQYNINIVNNWQTLSFWKYEAIGEATVTFSGNGQLLCFSTSFYNSSFF